MDLWVYSIFTMSALVATGYLSYRAGLRRGLGVRGRREGWIVYADTLYRWTDHGLRVIGKLDVTMGLR